MSGGLTEAAWQAQVEGLARFYGWRTYHPPDNRPAGRAGRPQRVTSGFPDLVLLRGPELLFVELKTDKGRASPEQREWLGELAAVGDACAQSANYPATVEAYIWRPRDFDDVHARLARGRHQQHATFTP